MRGPYTGDPAEHLCADIDGRDARWQFAAQRESDADSRIEMRAGYRAERENEHGQDRAGRKGVAKKRQRAVTPASFAAMIPEPTTPASRNAVPKHSATPRCASDGIRCCRFL